MLEPELEALWFTKQVYEQRVKEHLARAAAVPTASVTTRMGAGWFSAWVDHGDEDALLHVSWGWALKGLQARVFFPAPHEFEREFFGDTCFQDVCSVLPAALRSVRAG